MGQRPQSGYLHRDQLGHHHHFHPQLQDQGLHHHHHHFHHPLPPQPSPQDQFLGHYHHHFHHPQQQPQQDQFGHRHHFHPHHQQPQLQPRYQQNHHQRYVGRNMETAQIGYNQFVHDFGGKSEDVNPNPTQRPKIQAPIGTKRDFNSEIPTFDVDDRWLEDNRPIIDYRVEGEREFKLFDDHMKCDLKSVYNVNDINYWNPREICSRKVHRQSVQRWPVDILGSDMAEWRKSMAQFIGRCMTDVNGICVDDGANGDDNSPIMGVGEDQGSSGLMDLGPGASSSSTSSGFLIQRQMKSEATGGVGFARAGTSNVNGSFAASASTSGTKDDKSPGAFGLVALARLLLQEEGVNEDPTGYVTFMGMNVHKLFRNIDKVEPITPTFAGPFANHNHTLDYGSVEVARSFHEYNLPCQPDWPWQRMEEWRQSVRIKQPMMKLYSFETLMLIFYTMPGEMLQVMAARELHQRGWRFHKLFQVWVTPFSDTFFETGGTEGNNFCNNSKTVSSSQWEKTDIFTYFNYLKWDFFKAEFKITPGILTEDIIIPM